MIDLQAGQRCGTRERRVTWQKGWSYRGEWAPGTRYLPGDVVLRPQTGSFVARGRNQGLTPEVAPDFWGVLARNGATGATGLTGPSGTGPAFTRFVQPFKQLSDASGGLPPGLVSLTLPSGQYVLTGIVNLAATGTDPEYSVLCSIEAGSTSPSSRVDGSSAAPHQNLVVETLSTYGPISGAVLFCYTADGDQAVAVDARLTAVRVTTVTQQTD